MGIKVERFAELCKGADPQALRDTFGDAFLLQRERFIADNRTVSNAYSTLVVDVEQDKGFSGRPDPSFLVFGLPKNCNDCKAKWITVGRNMTNTISINHETVSKLHAFFVYGEENFILFDAGSKNKTFLNGEQVGCYGKSEGSKVKSGDRLQFGATVFMYLSPEEIARLFQAWNQI
jgi:hypothetical protein